MEYDTNAAGLCRLSASLEIACGDLIPSITVDWEARWSELTSANIKSNSSYWHPLSPPLPLSAALYLSLILPSPP